MRVPITIGLALLVSAPAAAQSIASRVAQAPDGVVRMEFESRAGVCGDGRDVVAYRNALFMRGFQSIGGGWHNTRCVPGPLRVTLTIEDREIIRVRTQVGGSWPPPAAESRVTDLGVVESSDASAYFFSLVPRLERTAARDRLFLPAVLADGAPVIQPLYAMARDDARTDETRRHGVQWLGMLGGPQAYPLLHSIIEDASEDISLRAHAIFALAHGYDVPASEYAYLRALYQRLDNQKMKESIFHGMTQDEGAGGRWLIERAMDVAEPMKLRRSALFWAGQREETPTAELVRAYREGRENEFREHAIFVLSQRKDDAATEALLRIVREDGNKEMRGKALFWLAQKDDPRVRKLIADLVLR